MSCLDLFLPVLPRPVLSYSILSCTLYHATLLHYLIFYFTVQYSIHFFPHIYRNPQFIYRRGEKNGNLDGKLF